MSEDFTGEITEDAICITDHSCPIAPFIMYEGELQFARNRFLDDRYHPLFNTLQSELYDSNMAEVLGRIETSALPGFNSWDWAEGHHLVIVWPTDLSSKVNVCPYGNYMAPAESTMGDGLVQVFETFTDPLQLAAGPRDLSQNMEVVLNIRHDYDLDVEDITELLVFRIAMIPKTWTDAYGDTIKKTSGEIAECLNQVVNDKAKVDGWVRRRNKPEAPKKKKNNKWKKKGTKNAKN